MFPEPAVVLLVRFGHRRVQPGHDDFAVGDLDQRPFRADTEADRGVDTIEPPQQGVEAFPLRPVRRLGIPLEGLLTQKVGLAEQPVDVVVARDDHEPVPVEFQAFRQCDEEVVYLVELVLVAGLGQVTGDHDEVRSQPLGVGSASQIVVQPGEQGRVGAVGLGESGPAEHVVRPELDVGDVQHRDGRLRGLVRPARGCPARGGDRTGSSGEIRLVGTTHRATVRAGELRGDSGLRPTFDGAGDPRQQPVGGGRLVAADQIDIGDRPQQAIGPAVRDPDRHDPAFEPLGVLRPDRQPLGVAVPGFSQIGGGQDRHHPGRDRQRELHAGRPVRARDEVPRLHEHPRGPLAGPFAEPHPGLKLPRDPLRPGGVRAGVTDEEVVVTAVIGRRRVGYPCVGDPAPVNHG